MTALGTHLDDAFLRHMADRFPRAAFSTLSGSRAGAGILSPGAWLATLADREPATVEAALAAQLGSRGTGDEAASPVRRAALALLAAYAAGHDVSGAVADLNMWAVVAADRDGPCDPSVLVDGDTLAAAEPVLARAAAAHAWPSTVALAVVTAAKRSNGVLPNAHFLWLAAHDRTLWLLLDGYGRRQPAVEILGAVAHHAAEIAMGHPLETPLLDEEARAVLRAARPGL